MFESKYDTPKRRKLTIDETYTDKKLKASTVQTILSRDNKFNRQTIHWHNHEHRKQIRMNSMLKIRKGKLQEITSENHKIFMRINEQQSHYPSSKFESIERIKNKQNEQDEMMGHLKQFQTPTCFLVGDRGIMCEHRFGVNNVVLKQTVKRLPQLNVNKENLERQYRSVERTVPNKKQLIFYPSNKQRRLPDIYMMI